MTTHGCMHDSSTHGPSAQISTCICRGDVTAHLDATERTIVFAKVVLAMYLGLVVGPLVGGTLIAAKIITNAQALYGNFDVAWSHLSRCISPL